MQSPGKCKGIGGQTLRWERERGFEEWRGPWKEKEGVSLELWEQMSSIFEAMFRRIEINRRDWSRETKRAIS